MDQVFIFGICISVHSNTAFACICVHFCTLNLEERSDAARLGGVKIKEGSAPGQARLRRIITSPTLRRGKDGL